MTITDETADRLAEDLHTALHEGEPIDPLTASHDLTIEDAYAIQDGVIDRELDAGGRIVGHKIGLTGEAIRNQLGVDEPDFGRLLGDMFLEDRVVPTDDLIAPRVEPEIGFVLDEDLTPPVTYLDVLNATARVTPVVEVIDSRVRDWEIEIQDTIADNASSAYYLTGDRTVPIDDVDLSLEGLKLYRNGTLTASGVGAAVLEHPARAVAWLVNALGEFDESVRAGEIILSGSFTSAVDVESGDTVTVEFASLGSVTVSTE